MQVSMVSSAGAAHSENEDLAGAVPGAVVLLDGAGIPGTESICSHGVAWYTHRLGGALLGRLSRGGGPGGGGRPGDALQGNGAGGGLVAILADAIAEVAAAHGGTCDLRNPSSPQATVLMARVQHDRHADAGGVGGRLEYLLLADSHLVLDRGCREPQVITDEREVAARRACSAPLEGLATGTPAYDRVRAACVAALRARRNQPNGYWIAKDDPHAAEEALTGGESWETLHGIALVSNGASRLVDPYGLTDWPGVLHVLRSGGPAEVIRRVREAEADPAGTTGGLTPDDATIVHWTDLTGFDGTGSGGT